MVYASCSGGQVQINSSPKLGYQADDLAAGPARTTWVTFSSGAAEVHVTVTCGANGKPVFRVTSDDHGGATTAPAAPPAGGGGGDDHGGGRGGGGGGGSRGGSGGGGSGGGGGGHDG